MSDHDAAVQKMRTAAAMEDATEKSPVSPGSVAPAPEMLGDMFLLAKQPKLALAAYESALKIHPRTPQSRIRRRCFTPSRQEPAIRRRSGPLPQSYSREGSHADSDLPELTQANQFFVKD